MSILKFFKKKINGPYKDEYLVFIYNLLFCDNVDLLKNEQNSQTYPLSILLSEKSSVEQLKEIAENTNNESRVRCLAYRLLAKKGIKAEHKELLGVIVEVSLPDGLDVLAAYSDGTARYLNHSERLIIWETQTEESKELIEHLFAVSASVIDRIGPWHGERRPFPKDQLSRMTFLVSGEIYFGEGSLHTLQNDPMGGPVIDGALGLLSYFTQQAIKS